MKKRLGFHLVFLGMIASGKDTQADILKREYNVHLVESGKYWRKLEKANTPDGEWLRRTTAKGKPTPVPLMKKFLIDQLAKTPKNKDILFIGNPRLKPEAQLLKKLMKERGQKFFAIYITLPEKEAMKRSVGRMRNADDAKYTKRRIAWHKDQVSKTVTYFESLGLMKKINGNQSIEKVSADIKKAIVGFTKQMTK